MRTLFIAALFAAGAALSVADDAKALGTKEKLAENLKQYRADMAALNKEIAAAEGEEKAKLTTKRMDLQYEVAKKAFNLAKEFPKDPAAMEAVRTAMQAGNSLTKKEANELIFTTFVDDPKVCMILGMLSEENVAKLSEKTKNGDIKGTIQLSKIEKDIQAIDYNPRGKPLPKKEADEKFAAAVKKLDELSKELGTAKFYDYTGESKSTITEAVNLQKFFIDNLTIGRTAPDMTCDLLEDGKKGKLSDYRGKVVVVDFWATWCPPCRAMIPHEREMTEKLKDKPFALISVSGDDKKTDVTDFLKKEAMPWNHFWSGPKGSAVKEYQIHFWPTIYVLDCKGVIRYKHVRGKDMEEAVETLLKENESGGK